MRRSTVPRGRRNGAQLPGRDRHGFTDPVPGTNGGLWWNGTRFTKSLTACQWISAITCTGISGYRTQEAGERGVRQLATVPCSTAVSGERPSSRTWMRAHTSSPGSENAYWYDWSRPKNGETCRCLSCS